MDNESVALRDGEGGAALRHYTYYRPTILILLKEHESHGYELVSRMADLGFDQRLASSLYGVLRDMESENLIASSWDLSGHGGPPRRVYSLTGTGDQFLHESVPTLVRQRQALDAMLDLYSRLEHTKQDTESSVVEPSANRHPRQSRRWPIQGADQVTRRVDRQDSG